MMTTTGRRRTCRMCNGTFGHTDFCPRTGYTDDFRMFHRLRFDGFCGLCGGRCRTLPDDHHDLWMDGFCGPCGTHH